MGSPEQETSLLEPERRVLLFRNPTRVESHHKPIRERNTGEYLRENEVIVQ